MVTLERLPTSRRTVRPRAGDQDPTPPLKPSLGPPVAQCPFLSPRQCLGAGRAEETESLKGLAWKLQVTPKQFINMCFADDLHNEESEL